MRKIVISGDEGQKESVVKRLQEKFPESIVVSENELTRANVVDARDWLYHFISMDLASGNGFEGYFFHMVWNVSDDEVSGLLELFESVYADDTHWRYFIINADGNPLKTIANILNYDYGPVVSKVHLPGENYEYIP